MRSAVRRAAVLAGLLIGVTITSRSGGADTVYRWTDERGVVHFSDGPPAQGTYKTETMPDAPPPPPKAAESGTPTSGGAAAASDTAEKGEPARVVLTDQRADAVSASVQTIRGRVKNEGGSTAEDVSIAVVVVEPVQGAECLQDRIEVEPATLEPGQEGTFSAQFDNPCFHGPTEAQLKAEWR